MKPAFKRTIDSGNLEGARTSLANEMMLDPRGHTFKEMLAYAEAAFPNLYEKHNGAALDRNQANWNESMLFATRNALDDNFSKERLSYYYDMAKVVLKEKAATLERESRSTASRGSSARTTTHNERQSNNKINPLHLGLAAGGLVVGGIGLLAGKAAIAIIGLAGAAIGGALIYNDKKK